MGKIVISIVAKKELYDVVLELKRRGVSISGALGLVCGRYIETYPDVTSAADNIQQLFREYVDSHQLYREYIDSHKKESQTELQI